MADVWIRLYDRFDGVRRGFTRGYVLAVEQHPKSFCIRANSASGDFFKRLLASEKHIDDPVRADVRAR